MDTQKYRDFVKEPMANKPVTALPGVGDKYGSKFEKIGITKASQVYGQYLLINRNHVAFEDYMKNTVGANRTQALNCSKALEGYYQHFQ